ncbi:short chain dehydrogenase [Aureispira sp. CCB-E]|uniref:short chain dehydrogenase n=1 Tax=Aureispira sp. CCB-E TaxID=3051121 RepID=UPI00286956A9|nr:short chain dehydrogenase [Aureispira sp. CCB-E]WMX15879.1 short chain dehydrogenase [Aureispira sp. CCB-E]
MKILIIGGNGTVGQSLAAHFATQDEVIIAGRTSGSIQVDIEDSNSIRAMFENIGKVDAIICVAGEAKWADFDSLSESDYYIGLRSKLMGQVNLVRLGKSYLNKQGSITLSTGILADDPVAQTASAAMVNGALHSFVKAAVLDLKEAIRVNVVSLGVVEAAYDKYKEYFPGHHPISTTKVINAYVRSVKGRGNGEIIRVYH